MSSQELLDLVFQVSELWKLSKYTPLYNLNNRVFCLIPISMIMAGRPLASNAASVRTQEWDKREKGHMSWLTAITELCVPYGYGWNHLLSGMLLEPGEGRVALIGYIQTTNK